MASHPHPHSRPSKLGMSREVALQTLSTLVKEPPGAIVDAVVIATIMCDRCALPHLIKLSATTGVPDSIVAICAMAVTDILVAYEGGDELDEVIIFGDHE